MLFALLLQLLAHLASPAAPAGGVVPAAPPAVLAPAPDGPAMQEAPKDSTPAPAPETVADCPPGQEWQGEFGCVQPQLPAETIGRADW